ncbi:uncharacterized protein F5147DRAFT_278342 [Suillus discolor]|uniref:Yeast cell wall synthesis Kre9/Knh1-like N-terminal domain-containing protein n=1 Tax=Suillus discolor TaxID=1912936 RepID=A0A9P7F1Q4_9AGAM|nr:uncharacterized protein F5147DRAFT_278342 [Suillus discolor]KAG2103395.1 hypothetical protein F5147DRAFT_278342 [Suillus discolor]
MFSKAVISFALAGSALANVFITSPVASTTFTAGQQAIVNWQDDGLSPNLTSFGASLIGIYTGNANQQTLLQTISSSVDVSTTSSINFTPDGTIGPDSDEYFVRFTSINLKDATNSQFPAEAFSAKFTMTGMTGTFNTTVQDEINGQSTAPIGATTTATATSSASGSMKTISTSSIASTSGSQSSTSTSATATKTGAAGKVGITGITCFVGAAASLLGAMLL